MTRRGALIRREERTLWVNSREKCELRIWGLHNLHNGINKAEILAINKNFIDIAISEEEASSVEEVRACRLIDDDSLIITQRCGASEAFSIKITNFGKINRRDINTIFYRDEKQVRVEI